MLFFSAYNFEVHYLYRVAKLIWTDPAPFATLLYSFKLCH